MRRTQTSSTAKGTAAVRAIESERPGNTGICHDPYARRFTSTMFYLLIRLFRIWRAAHAWCADVHRLSVSVLR